MESFSNLVVLPENLPEIKQEAFNPLNKKYLNIIYIRLLIFALLLIGGFVALLLISDEKPPFLVLAAIVSAIVVLLGYSTAVSILGFSRKGYLVRENDISYQRGLISYQLVSVPFNRIQHVEVNQGVLAKTMKLATVKIYTAGGTSSDVSIPGLLLTDAQKLKAFLSEKISEYE